MYLPYQVVHTPLQVPEEYVDLYPEIVNETRRYYAGMFMKNTCMAPLLVGKCHAFYLSVFLSH